MPLDAQVEAGRIGLGESLDHTVGCAGFDPQARGQAVNRLAPGLVVEARSPDGVIEAFSQPDAPGFNLCVQWHPEWLAQDNPISMQLFAAFGAACREFRSRKTTP